MTSQGFVYDVKPRLITASEGTFFLALKKAVPPNYEVFPQVNLASIIQRNDNARFHNELFRNVDFLITDEVYAPKLIVEINDQTHLTQERRERDQKVHNICEEAGIRILTLWTNYGVNQEYITGKVAELLMAPPVQRIHHEKVQAAPQIPQSRPSRSRSGEKSGCYIATSVYGSYDCPHVWVLRRYRDHVLASSWYGRLFIKCYYAISPTFVKYFGQTKWFKKLFKRWLDKKVNDLLEKGFEDTPYCDYR